MEVLRKCFTTCSIIKCILPSAVKDKAYWAITAMHIPTKITIISAELDRIPTTVTELNADQQKDLQNLLDRLEEDELAKVKKRLHRIMHMASDMGIGVFVDAEETWVQEAMDALAEELMETYNKKKVVAYNTFQMYRKDRLDYLKYSFERSQNKNYYLGAKIVRGAYMVKERQRAEDQGIASPIQDNKEATDLAFDQAIGFCVKHYNRISSCNASHNAASCLLQARLISELSIPRNHSHLNFCQLMGMSDNITFNLAQQGYNVAKYVVYGSIAEVIPFLIRRAHENTFLHFFCHELHILRQDIVP